MWLEIISPSKCYLDVTGLFGFLLIASLLANITSKFLLYKESTLLSLFIIAAYAKDVANSSVIVLTERSRSLCDATCHLPLLFSLPNFVLISELRKMMSKGGKVVAVTGASGCIASWLVKILALATSWLHS